jgi:hypothetical protein
VHKTEEDADSNPFDLRINDAQRQQLNACFHALHTRDERFRELISRCRATPCSSRSWSVITLMCKSAWR